MITSFTHATWFTHSTHDDHKISFTHDTQDLRRIYATGNLFTHDTLALIVFTNHVQTGNYLRMILRIYAYLRMILGLRKSVFNLHMICMIRMIRTEQFANGGIWHFLFCATPAIQGCM
jgi:hypothetical protein